MYFLIVGIIMAIGYNTIAFTSAISPWATLRPLAFVVSMSPFLVEGHANVKRYRNDEQTSNNASCVVLRRGDELDADKRDNKSIMACRVVSW
jgi:phospholipid-translocating ATPase/phospholipid-transporting ATPase